MQDLGKLLLRITIGGLLLPYGIHKIIKGTTFVAGQLDAAGLPEFLQYGVYVGEVAAPALLIVGYFTRLSGLAVAGTMAFAIYLAHMDDITTLNAHGGWGLEHPMVFLLGGLCIALLGAGRMSFDHWQGKPGE